MAIAPSSSNPTPAPGGATNAQYAGLFNAAGSRYGLDPRLLEAVARQESGFNPNAKSPAGALGLMQFMPATAKGLGINPLDPAQAVDGAARLLSNYIKQFGSVDLALAAYNAGPGAVQKYNGVPPFKETQNYVRSITSALGGSSGLGTQGGASLSAPGSPNSYTTPQTSGVADYIAEHYGWAAAYINVPEVGDIIRRAAAQQWGMGQLQQAIYATNWYKSQNEAQRTWDALVTSNPGEADSRVRAQMAHLTDLAANLGVVMNAGQSTDLATRALREGWTSDQLRDAVIMLAKTPANLAQSGSVPATMSALKQKANDYGINLSDQTLFDMAWHVGAGEQTIEGFTPQFQQWAKQKYSYWAPQIDAGFTVSQLADPYKQDAAKLLEVAPESIDLFNNPQWSKALSYADPKTGENRPMTLSEWQTYLRGTDQWKGTQQGQQAASAMAEGLLNSFGKVKSSSSGFGG